ncbi:hypothetical protein HQ346_21590 [Rhodococcus sp. BP-252]|uniref:nucleoside 2-deoxyribosyltransferase n=1 Tax=unclassified Rhodococcus (in: high G+C Gram-positive bacteria) TaxID=192944 RepID=UPI001C9BB1CE|nr:MULTISPECIES: nucleoside 2-deoxyribosyltransferase [unclassified Rhodococcus (in: high G+C Gram-positive bacteria)]MBY6414294.1 hypothetical protein [Rhodococcus sp. BP-320]MBY6419053.1 hypothetical protein [Rhodococcus sp. BP-321]MBY6423761.1 hypothetical protein [Rhodococcus sp. BP-324]MBY6429087.1 hypothetical protein [Rhodococcus sp. BP-323]MBY6434093.1 hypothetical protein [Rhodococcus sp. BP-322]
MAVNGDGTPEELGEPSAPDSGVESSRNLDRDSKPPKKNTSRKTAKKAPAKKATPAKATPVVAKFPRHTLVQALRIPEAIYKQNAGNPATLKEAVAFAGGRSVTGAYQLEISSAKKYGFLKSEAGKLVLEERARRAIAPQSEGDRVASFREAVLAAPEIADVYNFYRGENLPDANFLVNALTDKFGIPNDKTAEFLSIFNDSLEQAELIDDAGDRPRLRDIGRDERHQSATAQMPGKNRGFSQNAGTGTCFVMQPFQAPLGGYYESIFLPAIEQTGLTAVRADADIFGTGKIIDQIWRGIRNATVLIAELTTKNPNVFYELGLAHALQKPVILVSSNQDDVPFDLRHIRVILYDKSDPFWGSKLIDKVADNVRSAINDPEDAIFRIEDVR